MANSFDDVTAKILENKAKRDAANAPAKQPVVQNTEADPKVPAVDVLNKKKEEAAPPSTEPQPIVDETKAEASTTNPTPPEKSEGDGKKDEEVSFEWDADEPKPAPSQIDLKKIGSALNLEVNSEDELIQTVSEKMSKLKELEAKLQEEDLPTDFKTTFEEAKKLAKQGGDWQTVVYSSLLDASKLDPLKLFEQEYEKTEAQRFRKEDGTIDYDALYAEHDSIPEGVRKMQGNLIKQQLVTYQTQQKQAVLNQAKQAQETFTKTLVEAAKELANSFPQDVYGIKLEASHAASIQNDILNGKLVKEFLGNVDATTLAKLDAKKLMTTLTKAKLADKLATFNYKRGLSQGKRELLDRTQNPQLDVAGRAPEPDKQDKPKTRVEIIQERMQSLKPANSL